MLWYHVLYMYVLSSILCGISPWLLFWYLYILYGKYDGIVQNGEAQRKPFEAWALPRPAPISISPEPELVTHVVEATETPQVQIRQWVEEEILSKIQGRHTVSGLNQLSARP